MLYGKGILRSAVVLALLLVVSSVIADTVETNGNVKLNDVVVTGTKTPEKLKNAVDQMILVTGNDIRKMGASNMEEVLRNINGVNLTTHSGTYVQMNGMSGDYVKILVDGIPISSKSLRGTPLESIAISEIKRIEIVKGAGSCLYGSDAIGGVINIITKKGVSSGSLRGTYDGRLYSNEHWGSWLNFSGSTGKLGFRLQGGMERDNGRTKTDEAAFKIKTYYTVPEKRKGNGRLDLFYRGIKDWKLDFSAAYMGYESFSGYTSSTSLLGPAASEKKYEVIDTRGDLSLRFDGKIAPKLSVNGYFSGRYFEHKFNELEVAYGVSNTYSTADYVDLEGEARFHWRPDRAQHITAGFNFLNEKIDSEVVTGERKRSSFAAFVQDKLQLGSGERFFLVGGVRFTHNEEYGNDLSPRIGLRYRPGRAVSLRLSYGHGFKAPTFKENYFVFFHSGGVGGSAMFLLFGNPDLKPERSRSLNFSVSCEPSKAVQTTVTGYYNKLHNLITSIVTDPDPGTYLGKDYGYIREYVNKENAYTTGFEADVKVKPVKGIQLSLGYSFLIAKYKEDGSSYTDLELRSKHSVKANLLIRPWSSTTINLNGVWNEGQLVDGSSGEYGPDFFILGLTVRHHFSRSLEVYGGVKNLLNNRESYFGLDDGFTAYAGVRIRLGFL